MYLDCFKYCFVARLEHSVSVLVDFSALFSLCRLLFFFLFRIVEFPHVSFHLLSVSIYSVTSRQTLYRSVVSMLHLL